MENIQVTIIFYHSRKCLRVRMGVMMSPGSTAHRGATEREIRRKGVEGIDIYQEISRAGDEAVLLLLTYVV